MLFVPLTVHLAQLCFAFQRWNEIGRLREIVIRIRIHDLLDVAKSLYHNATLEKVALLHLITDRERRAHEHSDKLKAFVEVIPVEWA